MDRARRENAELTLVEPPCVAGSPRVNRILLPSDDQPPISSSRGVSVSLVSPVPSGLITAMSDSPSGVPSVNPMTSPGRAVAIAFEGFTLSTSNSDAS
jgi:hypothetical protein